jgi:hypothetical protein
MVSASSSKKSSLLKGKKPRETTHAVVIDHEAVEAYRAARDAAQVARDELLIARQRRAPDVTLDELGAAADEAAAEADALREAADEDAGYVMVRIRAMAPLAFAALKAEFPPTEEDHQKVRELSGDEHAKAAWNRNEFQPRLVAASLVDPAVTEDEARGYMGTWSEPEWGMLVSACLNVNQQIVDTSSLVKASGRTRV